MSKSVTSPYDVAEHLRTPKEMAAYLEASMEEADGDAAFIAKALGDLARAKGMSQVAYEADLSRESLYKALSGDRNPSLDTFLRVVGGGCAPKRCRARRRPDRAYWRIADTRGRIPLRCTAIRCAERYLPEREESGERRCITCSYNTCLGKEEPELCQRGACLSILTTRWKTNSRMATRSYLMK